MFEFGFLFKIWFVLLLLSFRVFFCNCVFGFVLLFGF